MKHWTQIILERNWKQLKEDVLYYRISVGMDEEFFDDYYFSVIVPSYTAENRHYHNEEHIKKALFAANTIDYMRDKHRVLVNLALWFHDIVYFPAANNNELLSCLAFDNFADKVGITDKDAAVVKRLIMATKHTGEPADFLEMAVRDADLCDMDGDYMKNSVAIKKEYSHLTDEQWRKGRMEFLESFIKRNVYFTQEFQEKEAKAKENLKAEFLYLKRLQK